MKQFNFECHVEITEIFYILQTQVSQFSFCIQQLKQLDLDYQLVVSFISN